MPMRRAACEPCRKSKLACDHVKPVCGRCAAKKQAAVCNYRPAPFRRQRELSVSIAEGKTPSTISVRSPHHAERRYPNPGFLGQSSHTNIYSQLVPSQNEPREGETDPTNTMLLPRTSILRETELLRGQTFLQEILQELNLSECVNLVNSWLLTGSNLALASRFVRPAAQTVQVHLVEHGRGEWMLTLSRRLFEHSSSPLVFNRESSSDHFIGQSCFDKARWEILGLFFTAISMSTIDIVRHHGLYHSQPQRYALRKLTLRFSDQCLAFSLGLDCLNDIQVILQYENFINHSYTNGDQSFDSWRRLGDIISSIYALGYHERGRDRDSCPPFLKHTREAIFAFTYSADKNISIFLGRPPRMHQAYCDFSDFQIPLAHNELNSLQPEQFLGWTPNKPFSYWIEAWWSMVCALQKEEILSISRERNSHEQKLRANVVQVNVDLCWSVLPARFRLIGKLIDFADAPIERDFAVSARLNYLHVHFSLHLVLSKNGAEMSSDLLSTSVSILSLVNEQNIVKDRLISSGTGLVWRTAYYGLPAAGILCLALLNRALWIDSRKAMLPAVHQDLSVLVAYMEAGALVDVDEPNYALLSEATATIKIVLKQNLVSTSRDLADEGEAVSDFQDPMISEDAGSWFPWSGVDSWEFEIPFWTVLAEHPNLISNQNNCD